jgi:hypothetical protein
MGLGGPAWLLALGAPNGERHRTRHQRTRQVAVAMRKPDRREPALQGSGGEGGTEAVDIGRDGFGARGQPV